jgi:NAD(P)-dependent dehydrogenase (short-subunit alcohol dehydrogenase family)
MANGIALVTGASGHIGSAIAIELAREGYGVVAAYYSNRARAEEVSNAVAGFGRPARTIRLDIRNRESVLEARHELLESGWKISALINNAAVANHVPFEDISELEWNQMVGTNLYGAFLATQIFLPDVLDSEVGRVVNIGSIGGQAGGVNQVHYAVAKAGLIGLTKSISRLYASRSFTANCVSPGPIESPMMAAEQKYTVMSGRAGHGGSALGSAEHVASLVAFLLTPGASHISGQDIGVNGGAVVL